MQRNKVHAVTVIAAVAQELGVDEDLLHEISIGLDTEDGVIWVLTPKTGKPGHVLPAEIAEAAPTAGLMPTSSVNLGDWSASRLVQPKSRAGKR